MTTFRGIFLPTLLGVVVVLPPANAQAVTDPLLASALSELARAASGQQSASTWKHGYATLGGSPDTSGTLARSPDSWEEKGDSSFPQTTGDMPSGTLSDRTRAKEGTGKRGYLVKSSTADQPTAKGGEEPQLLTHAEAIGPPVREAIAQASSAVTTEVGADLTNDAVERRDIPLNPPLQPNAQIPTAASSRVRILNPQPGTMGERTTSLIVQYPADQTVQIQINGNTLDPETPTQTERDPSQNLITQTWYNIRLRQGENVITVQAGNDAPVEVRVKVENNAAKLEINAASDPRVRADGRSTIRLQGSISDKDGQPIKGDTLVTLTAESGQFVGADQDEDQPGFQVRAIDGQFTAELRSSLQAQRVRIRAAIENPQYRVGLVEENPPLLRSEEDLLPEIQAFTSVEFTPNLRPSLVSGVANLRIGPRGTNFWGSMRDFLNPDGLGGTEFDFDAALFATGPVGEWLFTGALNTSRALNARCDGSDRLFGDVQFCEQQYPVYGDSSSTDFLTPSRDSFYVRFERASRTPGAEADYAMWGDYHTNEFARASQLFTANNRVLHGFKLNYSLGNFQVTTLFSPNAQGFQRDTILPDGTSGLYFLSRRLVIPGSENVFIETEELNRPGTVLERRQLARGPDYEVDYDRGTLRFRRPLLATDFDLFDTGTAGTGATLVRRIVVTYQHEGGSDTHIVAGRLQYNFNQSVERPAFFGASYWREDMGMRDFDLFGLDFLFPLGRSGRIVGEYARSGNDFIFRGRESGSAYRVELNGSVTSWLGGRAYYRSVDENFLNNATASFSPGQTRYGASIAAQVTNTTAIEASYDFESNFGISTALRTDLPDLFNPGFEPRPGSRVDNSLRTFSAGLRQQIGRANLSLNYVNRSREDRRGDFEGDASQIVARLNVPLIERVTFRAQHEQNLRDSDALYPNRTTVGLDWAVYPGVSLRLAHQFFDGGVLSNNSITSLDTIAEREIFKDTTITSRYSVISGFGAMTGQGAMGLRSRIRIAPGLRLLLGYERVMNSIFSRTGAGRRFPQPFAVGQSAASLGLGAGDSYSIGLEYTDNPDFKASGRFEYSTGDFRGRNMVIDIGAAGKLSRSLTALLRYYQANSSNQLLEDLDDTINLRVGLAYRDPNDDKFNALLRYDFRRNPAQTFDEILQGTSTDSTDHVMALEAIYAPNWRWEFYGKYAFRISNFDLARNYSNNTATQLGQLRATYRLGYRTDIAGEVRWIGQEGYSEWGWAAEFGYYLSPDLRLGLGYSFGSVDDRDFSGFRSEGGPYFQVTFKVNELFGGFGRQRVVPRQQQESEVAPVAGNLPAPTSAAPQNNQELTESAVLNLFPELNWPFTSSAVKFLSPLESPLGELPPLSGHH